LKAVAYAAALLLAASAASAAPTQCPEHHFAGQAPAIANERLAARTRELCFQEFAVLHSGVSRTPLYAASRLTRDRVRAARQLPRVNSFHEEKRLPREDRSDLDDYRGSGFDRGHVAPSGDMATAAGQDESFSLANMVPQNPENNRNLWQGIEIAVRQMAEREGEVFVVTGPIFRGERLQRLNGRVLVPTQLWKAVYLPRRNQAGAYIAHNAPGLEWEAISIDRLREITGLTVFPALPAAVTAQAMALPEPQIRDGQPRDSRRREQREPEPTPAPPTPGLWDRMMRMLKGQPHG